MALVVNQEEDDEAEARQKQEDDDAAAAAALQKEQEQELEEQLKRAAVSQSVDRALAQRLSVEDVEKQRRLVKGQLEEQAASQSSRRKSVKRSRK